MMNLRFSYQYCDAARFCKLEGVVFANPTGIVPEQVVAHLAQSTHAREITRSMGLGALLFDPTAFGLPELYFEEGADSDLDWHEFVSAEPTTDAPTDSRPLPEFLAIVAAAPAFRFRSYDAYGQLTR